MEMKPIRAEVTRLLNNGLPQSKLFAGKHQKRKTLVRLSELGINKSGLSPTQRFLQENEQF